MNPSPKDVDALGTGILEGLDAARVIQCLIKGRDFETLDHLAKTAPRAVSIRISAALRSSRAYKQRHGVTKRGQYVFSPNDFAPPASSTTASDLPMLAYGIDLVRLNNAINHHRLGHGCIPCEALYTLFFCSGWTFVEFRGCFSRPFQAYMFSRLVESLERVHLSDEATAPAIRFTCQRIISYYNMLYSRIQAPIYRFGSIALGPPGTPPVSLAEVPYLRENLPSRPTGPLFPHELILRLLPPEEYTQALNDERSELYIFLLKCVDVDPLTVLQALHIINADMTFNYNFYYLHLSLIEDSYEGSESAQARHNLMRLLTHILDSGTYHNLINSRKLPLLTVLLLDVLQNVSLEMLSTNVVRQNDLPPKCLGINLMFADICIGMALTLPIRLVRRFHEYSHLLVDPDNLIANGPSYFTSCTSRAPDVPALKLEIIRSMCLTQQAFLERAILNQCRWTLSDLGLSQSDTGAFPFNTLVEKYHSYIINLLGRFDELPLVKGDSRFYGSYKNFSDEQRIDILQAFKDESIFHPSLIAGIYLVQFLKEQLGLIETSDDAYSTQLASSLMGSLESHPFFVTSTRVARDVTLSTGALMFADFMHIYTIVDVGDLRASIYMELANVLDTLRRLYRKVDSALPPTSVTHRSLQEYMSPRHRGVTTEPLREDDPRIDRSHMVGIQLVNNDNPCFAEAIFLLSGLIDNIEVTYILFILLDGALFFRTVSQLLISDNVFAAILIGLFRFKSQFHQLDLAIQRVNEISCYWFSNRQMVKYRSLLIEDNKLTVMPPIRTYGGFLAVTDGSAIEWQVHQVIARPLGELPVSASGERFLVAMTEPVVATICFIDYLIALETDQFQTSVIRLCQPSDIINELLPLRTVGVIAPPIYTTSYQVRTNTLTRRAIPTSIHPGREFVTSFEDLIITSTPEGWVDEASRQRLVRFAQVAFVERFEPFIFAILYMTKTTLQSGLCFRTATVAIHLWLHLNHVMTVCSFGSIITPARLQAYNRGMSLHQLRFLARHASLIIYTALKDKVAKYVSVIERFLKHALGENLYKQMCEYIDDTGSPSSLPQTSSSLSISSVSEVDDETPGITTDLSADFFSARCDAIMAHKDPAAVAEYCRTNFHSILKGSEHTFRFTFRYSRVFYKPVLDMCERKHFDQAEALELAASIIHYFIHRFVQRVSASSDLYPNRYRRNLRLYSYLKQCELAEQISIRLVQHMRLMLYDIIGRPE
ncbi:hypothetical protein GMRT_10323 [Giardia muris]|uniref:Uncharacterized protein n=1 Tax=Giardia muris TaxID=5742 RepID=A0A4Z1T2L7_GIAMU|nr:hypothetical protein GMRT_10323 [Giardia muris]|eukprot:TNJ29898.1 hypothetical protein GMRT_10323 [Giardia muris]